MHSAFTPASIVPPAPSVCTPEKLVIWKSQPPQFLTPAVPPPPQYTSYDITTVAPKISLYSSAIAQNYVCRVTIPRVLRKNVPSALIKRYIILESVIFTPIATVLRVLRDSENNSMKKQRFPTCSLARSSGVLLGVLEGSIVWYRQVSSAPPGVLKSVVFYEKASTFLIGKIT